MKIAVLVKQVPGTESSLSIRDEKNWIDESTTTFVMNPPDNFALEEALMIKEKLNKGEVVVVSMGPSRSQKVIREALAKGADRGIHIEEGDNFEKDPLSLSKVFASVLEDEKFDLIFTGLQSDDTGMGQTGVLIGELLKMSTATLVIETDCMESNIKVKRELESGWFQWVTLPLPASISIQSGLNTPRYPSLKGIMGAKKKEIKIISFNDFVSSPMQKIETVFLPETSKQTEYIEGSSDEIATRLADILKKEIKVV
jgi:electron transfer flavoprotein beta subunit